MRAKLAATTFSHRGFHESAATTAENESHNLVLGNQQEAVVAQPPERVLQLVVLHCYTVNAAGR